MKILFIGDIVGKGGRKVVRFTLPKIIDKEYIDLVIANGENAAGGLGISKEVASELFSLGINIITSGNHIWKKPGIDVLLSQEDRILRPANYPEGVPGKGVYVWSNSFGIEVGVINLAGRVFMDPLDCPFRVGMREVDRLNKSGVKIIVIDFHAEATSEKMALGWYMNGKISALVGTHTHVQTADERILPGGTGYLTDVGMTGSLDSVIGINRELSIKRFLTSVPQKFIPSSKHLALNGVILEISEKTGKCLFIKRINMEL